MNKKKGLSYLSMGIAIVLLLSGVGLFFNLAPSYSSNYWENHSQWKIDADIQETSKIIDTTRQLNPYEFQKEMEERAIRMEERAIQDDHKEVILKAPPKEEGMVIFQSKNFSSIEERVPFIRDKILTSNIIFIRPIRADYVIKTYVMEMNHIQSIQFIYAQPEASDSLIPVAVKIRAHYPIALEKTGVYEDNPALLLPNELDNPTLIGRIHRRLARMQYQKLVRFNDKYQLDILVIRHPAVSQEEWSNYLRWSKDASLMRYSYNN